MTVSVQTPINEYVGNGSTTEFVYSFSVFEQSDLNIYLDGEAQSTGFTVDGIGDTDGGTVTFTVAPANGVVVRLVRAVPLERTTDYTEGAGLSSLTLDNDLDRVWQAIQDLDRDVVRQDLLGTLLLGGVTLANIGEPANPSDAATKNYVDTSLAAYTTDHGALSGLADDDHTQYHTDARGDARYYTQTQLMTTGVLDARYYTEAETNNLLAAKASSSHTHDDRYFTEAEVTSALSGKSDTGHTHVIASVNGLQTALDGKASSSHNHDASYSALGHTHDDRYYTETETDNLLANKASTTHNHDSTYAAVSHTHTIGNVTGLQTALDGKSATTHNHDSTYLALTGGTLTGNLLLGSYSLSGTNATLTGASSAPMFYAAEYNAGNSGTTKTINFANGINQKMTMTGNCAITLSGAQGGMTAKIKLIQDGSGGKTATWTTTVLWAGGAAPTLSTAASAIDIVSLYYDGTTWFGQFAKGFA